jgi:hypothetical protein
VLGRRQLLRTGSLLAAVAGLGACGVRWDDVRLDDVPTPDPPSLSADDLARFDAVVAVRALLDLAAVVPDPAGAVVAARHQVHLDRLGPLPGRVPSPSATPSGWPTTSPPPAGPVDAAALAAAETATADRLLASAAGPDAAAGGPLARLLVVVAASCRATATGLGAEVAAPAPLPAPDALGAGEPGGAGAVGVLVETHRAAAYGYGVLAVRLADAGRDAARVAIDAHTDAASGLVNLAAAAGTDLPPAQPAYVVQRPADAAAAAALALGLELDVAAAAGSLVAAATGGWRTLAADQLTGAVATALAWGPVPDLPGAPDL